MPQLSNVAYPSFNLGDREDNLVTYSLVSSLHMVKSKKPMQQLYNQVKASLWQTQCNLWLRLKANIYSLSNLMSHFYKVGGLTINRFFLKG